MRSQFIIHVQLLQFGTSQTGCKDRNKDNYKGCFKLQGDTAH